MAAPIMPGLAGAVATRLADTIAQYGTTVELVQAGSGASISAVGAFVELASASDHTPFFSSAVLDTFTLPLYTITIAGAAPEFSGTPVVAGDFVHMPPPGGSTVIEYKIRSVLFVCLVAGTPVKTLLLVSL